MPMCQVWNDNDYLFEEKFKGERIVIEPKQCIEMDRDDAYQLLSTFKPIVKLGSGAVDPRCFKMLRVEGDASPASVDPLLCHATGKVAASAEELAKVLSSFSHLKARDEEAEKHAAKLQAENVMLRDEIAQIKAMVEVYS